MIAKLDQDERIVERDVTRDVPTYKAVTTATRETYDCEVLRKSISTANSADRGKQYIPKDVVDMNEDGEGESLDRVDLSM